MKNWKLYYKVVFNPLTAVFKELYKKQSYGQIAKEYDITAERARQITKNDKKVDWDRTVYENYTKKIKKLSVDELMEEVKRLTPQDRRVPIVLQRQAVIKRLRNKYYFTFTELAKIFKRDHTSIMNLFYKESYEDKRGEGSSSV
jgi:hypothetical protein